MTHPTPPSLDVLLTHAAFVRAAARGVLGGDSEVEDVVQETWLRALDRQPRDPGALRGWLQRVARNLALDRRRSGARRTKREQAAARPEALPAVEDVLEREEARRRLVGALLALDPQYRDALLLRYYQGLSVPDVARSLDVPLETARTRLRRGLERLRASLGGGADGRPGAWSLGLAPWALDRGSAALAGGMVMKKVGAAALLLALVGGGVGLASQLAGDRESASSRGAGAGTAAEGASPGAAARQGPVLEGSAAAASSLPPPVDLEAADRDLDLFGVVVDGAGEPIAGATLQVVWRPWRRVTLIAPGAWELERPGAATRSAVDGTFCLRMRRGDRFDLRCTAPGFAPMDRRDCQAGQRLRIVMAPGATLWVQLVAEDGRSTQGTRVNARSTAQAVPGFEREALADERGHVRFEGLPGPVRSALRIEPAQLGMLSHVVDVPALGEKVVHVRLPVGRTVRGRVTASETGEPLGDATVAIGWTRRRVVHTDATGAYVLPGWHDQQGAGELSVSAPGRGTVKVLVGDREVVDVALEHGDRVVGRILRPDGSPWAGAQVGVVPVGEGAGSTRGDTGQCLETGADGRFAFDGLRRDQEHGVVAMAPGAGRIVLDVAPHPGGPGTIEVGDILLAPGQSIEGRVVGADGRPCPDVRVDLVGANSDRRRLPGSTPAAAPIFYGQSEEARTDDLGRFRFVDLPPGSYRLVARLEGLPDARSSIELPPGLDAQDVVLQLAAFGRPLVVTVVDAQGRPVPTARVWADGGREGVNSTSVDEHGRATVYVRPGYTTLGAAQMGSLPGEPLLLSVGGVPIPNDQDSIVLTLPEAALISGFVRDEAGQPVPGAQIRVSGESTASYFASANAQGQFRIALPPGERVDLAVEEMHAPRPGGGQEPRPARGELRGVLAGSRGVVVTVQVETLDKTLDVVVLRPDGTPQVNTRVSVARVPDPTLPAASGPRPAPVGGGLWREATTDAAGRVRFTELSDQPWRVVVDVPPPSDADRRLLLYSPITVRPSGQEVEIRLREAVLLRGQVVAERPEDLVDARVGVVPAGAAEPKGMRRCSPRGTFVLVFDPQEPLPWVLVARSGEAGSGLVGRVELDRAPTDLVTIELKPK